ncbi:MAG: SGNH/GDSL hydrolase family protein [Pseudomonadota bacterium]
MTSASIPGVLALLRGLGAALFLAQGAVAAPCPEAVARADVGGGEELHLVVLGTSLSAAQPWPLALASALQICLGRPTRVTVIAAAGMGSAWGLAQVGGVAAARPDLVLIEFATNDADLLDGVSLRRSRAQHRALVTSLRVERPATPIALVSMTPVHGLRQAVQRGRLPRYNAIYPELATELDAVHVDLGAAWARAARAPDWPDDAMPDGLHPRPALARRVFVPALLAALLPVLE